MYIEYNLLCATPYGMEGFQTAYLSPSTMISARWATNTSATVRITLAIREEYY